MKQLLLTLVVLVVALDAKGDSFDVYALQHNTRVPLQILVGEAQRVYKKHDQTGIIRFSERKWNGPIGLARYTLSDGFVTDGWMAHQLNAQGKVRSMIWVTEDPERAPTNAVQGQTADIVTTLGGTVQGLAEANPIAGVVGVPGFLVAKAGLAHYLHTKSLSSCVAAERSLTGMGWGAAVWNVAAIIAGGAVPWVIVPAIAAGVLTTPSPEEAVWSCIPDPLVRWASG